jgi:hypothetical protein
LAEAGEDAIFRACHPTIDVAKPDWSIELLGFELKVSQHKFGNGGLPSSRFSIYQKIRASSTLKDWGDNLSQEANLGLPVRKLFRQIVVPEDFSILKDLCAHHEFFEDTI